MRKKYKTPEPFIIKEIYPYFRWITCNKCCDEIKQESIWDVYVNGFRWGREEHGGWGFHKYYCKECFPTIQKLELYCNNMISV
jgi:hypothetical protein